MKSYLTTYLMMAAASAAVALVLTACGKPIDPLADDPADSASQAPQVVAQPSAPAASPESRFAGPEPVPAVRRYSAAELPVALIPAGADVAYPDPGKAFQSLSTAQRLESENENGLVLGLRDVITLPPSSGKPLFLVFPEAAFGTQIQAAFYNHRSEDLGSGLHGGAERLPASFDSTRRLWFISLSAIASKPGRSLSPMEQQVLNLDFILADAKRVELQLRFRAVPSAEPVSRSPLALPGLPGSALEFAQGSRSGRVVFAEEVRNPSPHTQRLWLRTESGGAELTTWLVLNRFEGLSRNPPQVGADPAVSRGRYRLDRVAVRASDGSEGQLPATGGWAYFDLAGGATAQLRWIAVPDASSGFCSVLPPESKTIMLPLPPHGHGQIPHTSRTEWSVPTSRLSGSIATELRVTDPYLPESVATAPTTEARFTFRIHSGKRSAENFRLQVGPDGFDPVTNPYPCQGVF